MCVAWIASTSYMVSWMITILGDTISIPDSVMGLTFLAAGMSVPEATSSVIVTNQGSFKHLFDFIPHFEIFLTLKYLYDFRSRSYGYKQFDRIQHF